nr:UDP-2,3-diacylglucosamine diphosphatase [Granulosicoccus sp.]
CKADFLLSFLRQTETENLFLVGDIIDLWAMRRSMFWPQSHNNVIRTILGKAKHDTRVIYIPGNHDEQLRDYCGMQFGNVEIHEEYEYTAKNGDKVKMLHGDKYDAFMKCGKFSRTIGSFGYDFLIFIHRVYDKLRGVFGFSYWSLARYVKSKVKNAVKHMRRFAEVVAADARRQGFDRVICGHIHHAEIREFDGVTYCNDGDWIENCTALVEHQNGTFEIIHWSSMHHALEQNEKTVGQEGAVIS